MTPVMILLLLLCHMYYRQDRAEYDRRVLLEARKNPPAA